MAVGTLQLFCCNYCKGSFYQCHALKSNPRICNERKSCYINTLGRFYSHLEFSYSICYKFLWWHLISLSFLFLCVCYCNKNIRIGITWVYDLCFIYFCCFLQLNTYFFPLLPIWVEEWVSALSFYFSFSLCFCHISLVCFNFSQFSRSRPFSLQ